MLTATPNPGSMLDRAIVAYLISIGNGLFTWANCYPADSLELKQYPNTTVESHTSEHTPMLTGIEEYHVSITIRYSTVQSVNVANPYAARVARDALVGTVMAAMMQSADGATLDATAALITAAGVALATSGTQTQQQNNADMVNFSCQHVYFLGSQRGKPDEAGTDWVEKRNFRISVSPTAGLG